MRPHPYLPNSPEVVDEMLEACGAGSLNDLYVDIPDEIKLKHGTMMPDPMSENMVRNVFDTAAHMNHRLLCFAGAGFYYKYAPAVALDFLRRSEFLTSYTPYQSEISQGTLQYILEYQSMMAELTGLDVSNASMYDGSTATAEAMMMCVAAARRRNRVLVSATLSPITRAVVDTYARYHGVDVVTVAENNGVTDADDLAAKLTPEVAGVIVASPNRYGIIEDFTGFADKIHAAKALFVVNTHAAMLASLRSPGEWGADIAVGEAQSLGMPLNFGGPYLGYMCVTKQLMRKMPGRIVGATRDRDGKRTFVLTLQAREQHIRREKATSNICSNQGIMTLYAAIYLSLMGAKGLETANALSYQRAHRLAKLITDSGKATLAFPDREFFNEFVIRLNGKTADRVIADMQQQGILAGVKVADDMLMVAVTEMIDDVDLDMYAQYL